MLDNFARRVRARLDEARGASQQEALRQLLVQQELDRLRALPCHSDPRCLVRFGAKVYSQNDEDGILAEVFRRIGTTNQRFVEIGVEAGLENNTLALLFQGWSGVWVEGHPPYVNQIRKGFQRTIDSGALQVLEAYVNRETVDALIAGACDVPEIDLLSLDIDGNDLHVFEAIQCVRPRVVVMEYNAKFPPPIEYGLVYDPDYLWEGDDCFGASLTTLEARMRARGYRLVGCNLTGSNAFFVRHDLVAGKFLEPYTAEVHYQPARYHLSGFRAGHPPSYSALELRDR
ncbi:MAG: FkbM family methyltransferase [Planctomycetes bacterium]|nr:FkbM family methyltransferase [Planctomycetota bacterium]